MTGKKWFVMLIWMGALLSACQPQEIVVEVTRVIGDGVDAPAAVEEKPPVEVTRLVEIEATRLITETIIEEIVIEVTKSPIGSSERPLQLLFSPTVNASLIKTRGVALVDALETATGREFEIGVLDSEQSVIDLMCAAPVDSIGFLSAEGYVQAQETCGVQAGLVAVHPDGYTWKTGMIVTRRDSGFTKLEDLDGKSWAVPAGESILSSRYFKTMFADAAIAPGETETVAGDSDAMLAVFNGDVDFATAVFIPPVMPFEERLWIYGEDNPDTPRWLGVSPKRSPIGYVLVHGEPEYGGYRLRDARSRIFDIEPTIYDETRIITLTAPIPNETIALGADFSLGLSKETLAALDAFADSEACAESLCASDFYGWIGLEPVTNEVYEPLLAIKETESNN